MRSFVVMPDYDERYPSEEPANRLRAEAMRWMLDCVDGVPTEELADAMIEIADQYGVKAERVYSDRDDGSFAIRVP